MNLRFISAVLALSLVGLAHSDAQALTYRTVITFEPTGAATNGQGPTSTDPADGNRVVLIWTTDFSLGEIDETDLDFLSFALFNDDGLIYEDIAIVDGLATALGGEPRSVEDDISFLFDFDAFNITPSEGLIEFDNDLDIISEEATGITYNLFFSDDEFAQFIDAVRYVDGEIQLGDTVVNDGAFSVITTVVPVPASALLLLAGLGSIALMRRRHPT